MYVCMYVCMYVYLFTICLSSTLRHQKNVSALLNLEVQVVLSYLMWCYAPNLFTQEEQNYLPNS